MCTSRESRTSTSTLPSSLSRRRSGGIRMGVVLLLMVPLAACATKRDIRDLGLEIRAQNEAQAERIAELRAEQESLETMVRSLSSTQEERQTQLLRQLRQLQEEVTMVGELAGASQAGLAAVRDELTRGGTPGRTGAGGFLDESEGGSTVDDLYSEALTAHGRSSLAAARLGFQEIVDRYPNHQLAPDARYYLADILTRQGELDDALRGFMQVAELYPTAPRVPEALYRAGLIHRDRGDSDQARALFTRIVNTWPESEVADMARAFLGGSRR
ncbi:MAG: outer membrane protein assembly factor BamD [Gemmatimonadales bacterium]|nr:MAG: outer membrane protein assembly factor BamD [Gemmatimonadales bacterium]